MFNPSVRARRTPTSARRRLLSFAVAAFLILQPVAFLVSPAYADTGTGAVSLTAMGAAVTENFNTLSNTAGSTTNSTLPTGWYITETGGGARDNEQYAVDTGGSTTGDTYSYGAAASTDRALGGLRSGTLIPVFGAKFTNNTGATITSLDISYAGEEWRLGTASRTDRIDFQISTNATDLSTGTYTDVDALDFTTPNTATTGAKDGNTAANRTVVTNSISGLSIANGASFFIRWTDADATGADDGLAVDDFSVVPQGGAPADAAPTVQSTTPANSATGVAINSDINITFSEPVNVSTSSFTISCGTSGTHTYALSGSSASYTLNPDTDFANSETCTVTVVANQVSDQDLNDPPDNMASNYVFSFTTVVGAGACGDPFTPIFQIQGSSTSSPMAGTTVTTEGVVTADFQLNTQQSGFYIQDPSGDGNTATSDGIFVFQPSITTNVSVGDRVRVTGRAVEFNTMTEIDNIISIQICSTGNTLPPPVAYDLPEPVLNDLERVEAMRVTFPEPLFVTGNNLQGRFGEVMLSSDGRLFQQNSFDRPNTPGALARAESNARRQIMLDDASSTQNPNPIPYIGADNTLRAGDTTTGLTGVIDYGLTTTNGTTRDYRVQPTVTPTFTRTNPRPTGTPAVAGTLRVASSNVLNYFNGDGAGGGFPTSRGASTQAEFTRQRAKIISALTTLNPDVLGVIEIENDGFNNPNGALQDLVNGLNDATAPGTYAGIDSPNPGTDEIKNAIIYKPSAVTPVGSQVNDVNPAWDQARPPLAQTFQQNTNNEKFTFIVNHFTAKGCSANDTGPDADQGDGQGCDNFTRQQQANRLLVFIQDRKTAAGDPDVLSMGDYNAYGEEDPMFILEQDSSDTLADGTGGLVSESKRFVPQSERYSFQFDAAFGELDHALATKSMNTQVMGTIIWHINADEPTVIDYNTEFKPQDLYTPTPYRSSDHDPLLVGLKLGPSALPGEFIISEYRLRGPGPILEAAPEEGEEPRFDMTAPLRGGFGAPPRPARTPESTPEANNEFIEFYNNSNASITVSTTDGSAGWALVAQDGITRFVIPNGTVIPARGHFLAVNSTGYSLDGYPAGNDGAAETTATGDINYSLDIEDLFGIALFNTANAANFSETTRLDAVGYSTSPSLYREGAGFDATTPGAETSDNIDYSFFRDMRGSGLPKDTGNNASDFLPADTGGSTTTIGTALGAPGPENLSSPVMNPNRPIAISLLDTTKTASQSPNRVRKQCNVAEECDPLRSSLGTMSIRRTVTNNTVANVTRLRFRIIDITTLPATGTADMRALTSTVVTATINDNAKCASDPTATSTSAPCDVTVQGTTLEEPPSQFSGGGWNSSLSVGTITLQTPLAPGASINVQFLLGVQQGGGFRFIVNTEALP